MPWFWRNVEIYSSVFSTGWFQSPKCRCLFCFHACADPRDWDFFTCSLLSLSVLSALLLTLYLSVMSALLLTPYLAASAERSSNWLLISQLALSALLLTPYLSASAERSVTDSLSLSQCWAHCYWLLISQPVLSALLLTRLISQPVLSASK